MLPPLADDLYSSDLSCYVLSGLRCFQKYFPLIDEFIVVSHAFLQTLNIFGGTLQRDREPPERDRDGIDGIEWEAGADL